MAGCFHAEIPGRPLPPFATSWPVATTPVARIVTRVRLWQKTCQPCTDLNTRLKREQSRNASSSFFCGCCYAQMENVVYHTHTHTHTHTLTHSHTHTLPHTHTHAHTHTHTHTHTHIHTHTHTHTHTVKEKEYQTITTSGNTLETGNAG